MPTRTLRRISCVGALCAAGLLWASSAGAQNGDGAAPRTAWGDPDLQGIWNNSTTTPLEQLTEAEQQRDRDARAPVIAATRGTGAAWPETGGRLEQPSLIIDPPNGRISMKPEAISRLVAREKAREGRGEADSWLDRNSWERCISRTMPVQMIPNLYNNNYQILQTPTHVAIQIEMIHETRIIPIDGRPYASEAIRQWLGDSRGHWEGDTLVVDTIHFHGRLDGGDYQPSHILQTGHRGPGRRSTSTPVTRATTGWSISSPAGARTSCLPATPRPSCRGSDWRAGTPACGSPRCRS